MDLVDGGHLQLQRRERPELLHDPETGHPFALISGVSPGWQKDQCFTLIQPVETTRESPLKADDDGIAAHDPATFNEVWEEPSVEPGRLIDKTGWDKTKVLTVNGSQPIGNGDLTAAAYPEVEAGRISMWLSKQDAIADDTSPFKLCQVSLAVTPNPWSASSAFFRQTLDFSSGTVTVLAGGTGEEDFKVKFEAWIDIAFNVAHLSAVAGPGASGQAFTAVATIETLHPSVKWEAMTGANVMTCNSSNLLNGDVLMSAKDTGPGTIAMYRRNMPEEVFITAALQQQGLGSLLGTAADPARSLPLANRTSGLAVGGKGFVRGTDGPVPANGSAGARSILEGKTAQSEWHVAVAAAVATDTVDEWFAKASALLAAHKDDWQPTGRARSETTAFWSSYADRSHIEIMQATAPPPPAPKPPPPPAPPLPPCSPSDVYCRINTTLDNQKDQICDGNNNASSDAGVPCASIKAEWCPDYRHPSQKCIEVAEASCNITVVDGKQCVAFAIFEKWGVEYYSSREASHEATSWAWTFFYRNPAQLPLPAPAPAPPPAPPPAASPSAALGFQLSQNYALTRFVHAVQSRIVPSDSRGPRLPIKFNGEAFTMQRPPSPDAPSSSCSASLGGCVEIRTWGPNEWWQNVRLAYWPMIPAGDLDHLVPVFEYYLRMLSFSKARTQQYFGHSGAFFTETKTVFGSYAVGDYGCGASRKPGYPYQLEANVSLDRALFCLLVCAVAVSLTKLSLLVGLSSFRLRRQCRRHRGCADAARPLLLELGRRHAAQVSADCGRDDGFLPSALPNPRWEGVNISVASPGDILVRCGGRKPSRRELVEWKLEW